MAGLPLGTLGDPYSSYGVPGVDTGSSGSGAPSHWMFIAWLVVLGIVLPAAILGGLKFAGFSFVFRGR